MPSKYNNIFNEGFINNGVEGRWVACKYLLMPSSPTICIVCLSFREKNR
jgi:hypothetical protein